jgi:hypothetical protein
VPPEVALLAAELGEEALDVVVERGMVGGDDVRRGHRSIVPVTGVGRANAV